MVNPLTVDGHVRGGTAQGIDTALLEQFEYDKNGQSQQISFQDYLMPRVLNPPLQVRIDSLPAMPVRLRALIREAEARRGVR